MQAAGFAKQRAEAENHLLPVEPGRDHAVVTSLGPQVPSTGVRTAWTEVPERVRVGVGDLLGSPVVEAVNQQGGFSPGLAARVRCADGTRAFVKAAGTSLNPLTPGMYVPKPR